MASSTHNHAPWRKVILVPFWIIQMIFLVVMVGVLALALAAVVAYDNLDWKDDDLKDLDKEAINRETRIILPVWFVMCSYSLLITITEIILLALRKLTPVVFVSLSGSKAVIWTVMLVLNIASIATVKRGGKGEIALDVILFLSFIIPFVYGCTVCCRARKSKTRNKKTLISNNPPQFKNFPDDHHDLESAPLAAGITYNHPIDTRYQPFRGGDRSVSPNPGMQADDHLIAAHPSPIPSINVQHNGTDTFEMGDTKNGNAVR